MKSTVLRVLVGIIVGVAVFVGLVVVGMWLGGVDCSQGRCNWFGEAIDDTAPLYLVLCGVVAFLVPWWILRSRS